MMRFLLVLAVLLGCAASIDAQVVIESERGPLEVIGLRRWTYRDLEDSIARYAPGESMRSHACAAVLETRLHFPSAAVTHYLTSMTAETGYTVVVVVEPQDSAKARRRDVTGAAMPPRWEPLRKLALDSAAFRYPQLADALQFLRVARQLHGEAARPALVSMAGAATANRTLELARVLEQYRSAGDRDAAVNAIRTDGNEENRVLAAVILTNFPETDATWHALIAALRDRSQPVASMAATALRVLRAGSPRAIDWAPASADLAALLGGANAWGYADLLSLLSATQIRPDLARSLLADNWHLVLSHARARHEMSAQPARALLAAVSGQPNATTDEWESWLKSLQQ